MAEFWLETGKFETLSDSFGGNDCGNSTCAVHLTAEELQATISIITICTNNSAVTI